MGSNQLTPRQEEILGRIRSNSEIRDGWFGAAQVRASSKELFELVQLGYLDSCIYSTGRSVSYKLVKKDEQ